MAPLSQRGQKFAEAGGVRPQLTAIWEDIYHASNNENGMINLGTAENFVMLEDVTSYINNNVKFNALDVDYGAGPWGSVKLRNAMANHLNRYFAPVRNVEADELVFSTGCTSLCEMLGFTLFEPGEGILLSRPIYQAFQNDFCLRPDVKPIFVAFEGIDQFTLAAVECYERAIQTAKDQGILVKAMVLCNPHNPLGCCYEPEAIIAYLKLCQKYSMHLIVDEIYALSIYKLPSDVQSISAPFKSILSFETDKYIDKDYLHLLYGFSKDLASGGLRLGCIWTRNAELRDAATSQSFFGWPSNICEVIGTSMLENTMWLNNFLETSQRRLGERSAVARKILDEYSVPYNRQANAGFFLWIDLRGTIKNDIEQVTSENEKELKRIFRKNKVYVTSGQTMSSEVPCFFRLCFAKPEAEVRLGLQRLMDSCKEYSQILAGE